MPAYVIVALSVTDEALYAEYGAKARESNAPFSVKMLAVDDSPEIIEGDLKAKRIIMLEFATYEEAKAWHSSEAYKIAAAIRHKSTDTSLLMLVKGLP